MSDLDILTEISFDRALILLSRADPDLANVMVRCGQPPFWSRPAGFATLVHIILEQQVSLASARAAFERLQAATSPLTPDALLMLDDSTMKSIGFSRQKTGYVRGIARAVVDGRLDLAEVANQPDEVAYATLVGQRGIGPWTANVYMLMALRRADVWPAGDLALMVAMQEVKRLAKRPSVEDMDSLAKPWRPWRAVAARLLWRHYLSTR